LGFSQLIIVGQTCKAPKIKQTYLFPLAQGDRYAMQFAYDSILKCPGQPA
jgi:hypothetical protein